ncbi:MAG TPA: L,D-transpeptidase [Blastocatellia bacterium]|nr:L,D-transpeptidase [Blastocatellia bacterium]
MTGIRNIEATNNDVIPGIYSKIASPNLNGEDTRTNRITVARRLSGLVLLTATLALTGSLAFGVTRGAAPRPSVAPPTAEVVNKAEQHLLEIGYWAGPAGDRDAQRARCAILAFQRVERRNQTGKLNAADAQMALAATRPNPRETGYSHIEVDLQRQVLFVVDQKVGVTLVLPVSSGSGKLYTFEGKTSRAVTPRGRFTVYRKVNGWRKAPLGMIYYPNYFDQGWAIHGSGSVPNYPASHGCIRIPISTAKELSDITTVGTVVLIYD